MAVRLWQDLRLLFLKLFQTFILFLLGNNFGFSFYLIHRFELFMLFLRLIKIGDTYSDITPGTTNIFWGSATRLRNLHLICEVQRINSLGMAWTELVNLFGWLAKIVDENCARIACSNSYRMAICTERHTLKRKFTSDSLYNIFVVGVIEYDVLI